MHRLNFPSLSDVMAPGPTAHHAKLEVFALQAFVSMVVHLMGMGVLVAFYYNFRVLGDCILALFWAVICSIPLFQIKMRILQAMREALQWWCREKYLVLSVEADARLKLRGLLPSVCEPGAEVDSDSDTAPELTTTTCGRSEIREDLTLPAEVMSVADLHRQLEDKHVLYAVVARQDQVVRLIGQGHWLGTLRPYESFGDFLGRDLPTLWHACRALFKFSVKPFTRFHHTEDGSRPYFGLLIRLCVLQFVHAFLGALLALLVVCLILLWSWIIGIRLAFTVIVHIAPHVGRALLKALIYVFGQEQIDLLAQCIKQFRTAYRKSRAGLLWLLRIAIDYSRQPALDNVHLILSILIILAFILVAFALLRFLAQALKYEATVIWNTFLPVARETLTHYLQAAGVDIDSETGVSSKYLVELSQNHWAPEYEEWLQNNVAGFGILKYILSVVWQDAPWASMGPGPKIEPLFFDDEACADAIALGASCTSYTPFAEERPSLQQQLPNTVACLQQLLGGNMSWANFNLCRDAYTEVKAAPLVGGLGSVDNDSIVWKLGRYSMNFAMFGAIGFQQVVVVGWFMLGQLVVFLTALFYLLAAKEPCTHVFGEFLKVIDRKEVFFRISELVVRAVLFSALKMSAFHALFTWFLYSWGGVPVVVVPTVLSALVALLPVVSPIWSISIWPSVYLWAQQEKASAALAFFLNLAIWWQVPTVIYAEIPESNPWLTGLSVVLGIGQFGVAGVILGPLIASVPLICFNLLRLFNEEKEPDEEAPARRGGSSRKSHIFNLFRKEGLLSRELSGSAASLQPSRSLQGRPYLQESPKRPSPMKEKVVHGGSRELATAIWSIGSGTEGCDESCQDGKQDDTEESEGEESQEWIDEAAEHLNSPKATRKLEYESLNDSPKQRRPDDNASHCGAGAGAELAEILHIRRRRAGDLQQEGSESEHTGTIGEKPASASVTTEAKAAPATKRKKKANHAGQRR